MSASDGFSSSPSVYAEPPLHLREPFLEHVNATARPETFGGLAFTKPVIDDRQHVIITTFDVDGQKRDEGDMVPCTLCSDGHPKFLHGALIWSPHDGHIRLVGNQCAAKEEHFGRRYAEMRAEHTERRTAADAIGDLAATFRRLPGRVVRMKKASGPYGALERQMQTMREKGGVVLESLKRAVTHDGGRLMVHRRGSTTSGVGPSGLTTSSGGASGFVPDQIAILRGHAFLASTFHPHRRLTDLVGQLEAVLSDFPAGLQGEDPAAAARAYVEGLDPGRRIEVKRQIASIFRAVDELDERAREAAAFLTDENTEGIKRWMDDPDFRGRGKVQLLVGGVKFIEWGGTAECRLSYIPPLPDIS